MKLTTEQIEYVENYIISKDIKWYELQVELTDHMVTSMEGFWEKNPELTFHQVKQYAEDQFGRNGFKAIEEERTQILRKEFKRAQLKMVAEYFKFPKIFGSFLLVIVAFKISFYFENTQGYIGVLFGTLIVGCLPFYYLLYKSSKIEGKRFLEISLINYIWLSSNAIINLGFGLSGLFKEIIKQNHFLVLPFCFLWMLGILSFITAIHLQKKTIENVKKQYQLI
jgi:hypothetical protein